MTRGRDRRLCRRCPSSGRASGRAAGLGRAAVAARDGSGRARRRWSHECAGGGAAVHLRANGREPHGEHLQQAGRRYAPPGRAMVREHAGDRADLRRRGARQPCTPTAEPVSSSVFARMVGHPRAPTVETGPQGPSTERSSRALSHQHDRSHQALRGRPSPRGPDPRGPAGLDLRLPRRQRRGQDHRPQDPRRPHAGRRAAARPSRASRSRRGNRTSGRSATSARSPASTTG